MTCKISIGIRVLSYLFILLGLFLCVAFWLLISLRSSEGALATPLFVVVLCGLALPLCYMIAGIGLLKQKHWAWISAINISKAILIMLTFILVMMISSLELTPIASLFVMLYVCFSGVSIYFLNSRNVKEVYRKPYPFSPDSEDLRTIQELIEKKEWEKVVQFGTKAIDPLLRATIHEPFILKCAHDLEYLFNKYPIENPGALFGDYADLIKNLTTMLVAEYTHHHEKADKAVEKLCSINTPISNNLLHLVLEKKTLRFPSGHVNRKGYPFHDEYDFEKQKQLAKNALNRRKNPTYDPSAYLNKSSWRLRFFQRI